MGIEVRVSALSAAALLAAALAACRLEPPDPASQAAAILHKHPSDFLDQLASLDAMAAREVVTLASLPENQHGGTAGSGTSGVASADFRPMLAESLYAYTLRLRPAFSKLALESAVDGAARDSVRKAAALSLDSARIRLLNAFLFDTLGIEPLLDSAPLAASVPSLVLKHRKGSCVGLVLIYLALGRSLDLPLVPVFLPGHIVVRFRPADGPARNIEALRRGIPRSDSFYRETFSLGKRPWYSLADGTPTQALGALIFNLGNARRAAGDLKSAWEEYRLAEEAIPGFPEALGNQGVCLMMEGKRDQAREKFTAALAGDSLSEAAWRNLDMLKSSR